MGLNGSAIEAGSPRALIGGARHDTPRWSVMRLQLCAGFPNISRKLCAVRSDRQAKRSSNLRRFQPLITILASRIQKEFPSAARWPRKPLDTNKRYGIVLLNRASVSVAENHDQEASGEGHVKSQLSYACPSDSSVLLCEGLCPREPGHARAEGSMYSRCFSAMQQLHSRSDKG
jgi:hypothetical protein